MTFVTPPAKLNELDVTDWQLVLGLGLRCIDRTPGDTTSHGFLVAKVEIGGAWRGGLPLGRSNELTRSAAAAMFGKEPNETSSEDRRDALGELANMVGGNFETLLKSERHLSVPRIVDALPENQVDPTSRSHHRFRCKSGLELLQLCKQPIA